MSSANCPLTEDENPFFSFSSSYIKQIEKSLVRIVYDEVHVYVTQETFRPHLANIEWLGALNCQKVALSATIPPRLQHQILKNVGLNPLNPIIREPSIQPHIKYHLLRVPDLKAGTELLDKLIGFVGKSVLKKDRQGIVFFKAKDSCQEYAERKDFPFNHSGRQRQDNDIDMEKFKNGTAKWICATPGLAAGVNVTTIDVTIFLGLAYGLIDFYQACGRGSRDGKRSDAIVIDICNDKRREDIIEGEDISMWIPMLEWSKGQHGCDRGFLTGQLDGFVRTCHDVVSAELCCRCAPDALHQELCSLTPTPTTMECNPPSPSARGHGRAQTPPCATQKGKKREGDNTCHGEDLAKRARTMAFGNQAGNTHFAAASARLLTTSKEETSQVCLATFLLTIASDPQQLLGNALQAFQNKCVYCLMVKGTRTTTRDNDLCTVCFKEEWCKVEANFGKPYPAWRKDNVRYSSWRPYTICYSCHTPQTPFEPPGHTGFRAGNGYHVYKGIMCRAVYLARAAYGYKSSIEPEEFGKWLVEKADHEFSNMIGVFLRIYHFVFNSETNPVKLDSL